MTIPKLEKSCYCDGIHENHIPGWTKASVQARDKALADKEIEPVYWQLRERQKIEKENGNEFLEFFWKQLADKLENTLSVLRGEK
jgi:hypothetical protein